MAVVGKQIHGSQTHIRPEVVVQAESLHQGHHGRRHLGFAHLFPQCRHPGGNTVGLGDQWLIRQLALGLQFQSGRQGRHGLDGPATVPPAQFVADDGSRNGERITERLPFLLTRLHRHFSNL